MSEITSFQQFWPYYLGEHAKKGTRVLHFIGTGGVIGLTLGALATGRMGLFIGVPLCGYGFAWVSHFGIEHNRPATFKYPFWSLAADFKMFFYTLTGKLGPELDAAGVAR